MRSIFFIRFLSLILCVAMIGEVTALAESVEVLSAEADTEMEHEESKEDEKEKTADRIESVLLEDSSMINQFSLAMYQDPTWNTPSIDFQTPPPELQCKSCSFKFYSIQLNFCLWILIRLVCLAI